MSISTYADHAASGLSIVCESDAEAARRRRILDALKPSDNRLPTVDADYIERYYKYLSERLSLPFSAHYPEPTNQLEEALYECTVLELLDPSKYVSDEFDGIFCKTRKGDFEVNLPLIELDVSADDPNFQAIEDYWYWFWNWR